MRLTVLVNELAGVKADQTTWLLVCAMLDRGHEVAVGGVADLELSPDDRVRLRAARLTAPAPSPAEALATLLASPPTSVDLFEEAGVLVRTNPGRDPRTWVHHTALDLLRLVRDAGVGVLNDPDGLARARSKLYLSCLPREVHPRTLVTADKRALRAFIEAAPGPVVLKPLVGSRGQDVFKVQRGSENLGQIVDVLCRDAFAMAQDFVPEAVDGDTRVILVEGDILMVDGQAAAVRRVPGQGEFRSNVFQGGHAEAGGLTPTMARITAAIGPRLRADGLFLVGMDLIGDRIVELNVFSPGGMGDANGFAGVDFIAPVVAAMERRLAPT
ncbi:MAG: hypothetical protein KC549_11515 [Myxococcales bacterium]|nr:hypothetical protein [Myxococcales bacterium]MCB9546276.1 glutathione synthase [Myxococcales bacterium]